MGRDIINRLFGGPESEIGPLKPVQPNPGLNLPIGVRIPDYRIYKVEDYPELVNTQRRLAARGIKSPWLRNEAWRYNTKIWGTRKWRLASLVTYGWKYAIPMLMVTAVYEYYLKKDDHHGHHAHH